MRFCGLMIGLWSCFGVGAQTHWLTHLTRADGGFESLLMLENISTERHTIILTAFEQDGTQVGTHTLALAAGEVLRTTPGEVFDSGPVSHLSFEAHQSIRVYAVYQAASGQSSPAHIPESKDSSRRWSVFAGNWDVVFDGLAMVNTGSEPASISVNRRDDQGGLIQSVAAVEALAPTGKALFVLGAPDGSPFGAMSAQSNRFEVVSNQPLALIALRGTPPGAVISTLWQNYAEPLPEMASGDALIVDHHCTDWQAIPSAFIAAAKQQFRIGYGHTSHGSQLVTGMEALANALGSPFEYDASGWGLHPGVFFNDEWGNAGGAGDLGHSGDLAWRDATLSLLQDPQNDRNLIIWSWCGGVSDNTEQGIDTYLHAMADLEAAYPDVRFVYMTGHLDGSGEQGTLHRNNERIRDFCRAHGKILFDFADIESFDPDAAVDFMRLFGTDGCDYDTDGDGNPWEDGNWADEWLAANPDSQLAAICDGCGDCAHSKTLNCVQKGGAVWWMLAQLAGWDGT